MIDIERQVIEQVGLAVAKTREDLIEQLQRDFMALYNAANMIILDIKTDVGLTPEQATERDIMVRKAKQSPLFKKGE